jgi:Skp family chaperone for outer membrane proteins
MMMSKGLIAFTVVICIAFASMVIIFMKQSADNARKRSDDIMEEFKKVDSGLQKSNSKLDSLNNMHFDSLNK